jgi:hypothetical protein
MRERVPSAWAGCWTTPSCDRLVDAGRANARRDDDWQTISARLLDLYHELIAARVRGGAA